MVNRRLLTLTRGSARLIALHVVIGLLVTATYAGQGLAVAGVLDRIFAGGAFSSTVGLLVLIAGLQVVRAVLVWWREIIAMAIGGAARAALRRRLYVHLLHLGPGHTIRSRTGSVLTALVDNVESIDPYVGRFLPQVIASVLGAVALIGYIFTLDVVVGTVVLVCALVVPIAPQVSRRFYQKTSKGWNVGYRDLYANSLDAIQGMTTLKAFNADRRVGEDLHVESERFNRLSVRLLLAASISSGVVGFATSAGTALSIGIGAIRLADGAVGVTDLLIMLLLTRECFRPLSDLERAYHAAYGAPAAAEGIFTLLDTRPGRSSTPVEPGPSDRPADPAVDVVFDDVAFSYRSDEVQALDGVTFTISPGETVAVVGRSGAGKSTLVSLLLRFFDAGSGTIRVGGSDITDLPLERLRALVSVVAQDTYLFAGTVRDNLLVALADASEAQIEHAISAAHAADFIQALPQGLDTVIGERGMKLSGGERQRLAIARALLKDAPILVLDEATSAVDAESEAAIQAALDTLTVGRTTLVIAHRLSTVRNADRIVLLDGGRVVEQGPPAELLATPGAYALLVTAQASA